MLFKWQNLSTRSVSLFNQVTSLSDSDLRRGFQFCLAKLPGTRKWRGASVRARILGSEEFAAQLRDRVKGSRREQKGWKVHDKRVTWDHIVKAVESVKGETWEAFRDRYGDWGRDAALYLGRRQGRMKLAELSQLAGGINYAAVGGAVSRLGKRLAKGELRSEMKKLLAQLSKS